MTVEEALAEGRRRWGSGIVVCNGADGAERCLIGVLDRGIFILKGTGPTWGSAFAAALGRRELPMRAAV